MEKLHISVTGFAKMTAPSFKNLPGRLLTPAALEISILLNSFRTISSVVSFSWNLVVMFKFLLKFFTKSIPYFFGGGGSFCSNVFVTLVKNVWKIFKMDFGSYLTTLSSFRGFIVAMET